MKNMILRGTAAAILTMAGTVSAQDALFIDGSGNVGIGTSVPLNALHVDANAGAAADVLYVENDGPSRIAFDNTTSSNPGTWRFNHTNAGEFRIADGVGGVEFTLTADGDLTVAGNIVSGGTTVVPDYVFADDYKLLSLDEVSAYIEKESHLPNVPSATEIQAKGGFSINKMQMRLLEKVEELTLYTLDQHDQLKTQSDQIQIQQQMIAELKTQLDDLQAKSK